MTTWKNKFNKYYGYDKNESHSLSQISTITGFQLKHLKMIFLKGEAAFYTNHSAVRPSVVSAQQWGMGRVYSAVMGGKASKVDAAHLIKK